MRLLRGLAMTTTVSMITIIAAIAENNCIGVNGKLPWSIPEDMVRFKTLTMGKTVLMGRKTWESLPAKFRPLPGRTNIVITRQTRYDVPVGVLVYPSLDAALARHPNVCVIGGAEIYAQALPRADRLEVTHVHQTVRGDTSFPSIVSMEWNETARESHDGFSFTTYMRVRVGACFTPARPDGRG